MVNILLTVVVVITVIATSNVDETCCRFWPYISPPIVFIVNGRLETVIAIYVGDSGYVVH